MLALITSVSRPPLKVTTFERLLATFSPHRPQRGLARFDERDVQSMVVEFGLRFGERVVRFLDEVRHVVHEHLHLIGYRVGEQHARPHHRQEECKVDGQDRHAARDARTLDQRDHRIEDQRDHARDYEHQQNFAGGSRDLPQQQQRERQHDQLDPAGDDDADRLGWRAT